MFCQNLFPSFQDFNKIEGGDCYFLLMQESKLCKQISSTYHNQSLFHDINIENLHYPALGRGIVCLSETADDDRSTRVVFSWNSTEKISWSDVCFQEYLEFRKQKKKF